MEFIKIRAIPDDLLKLRKGVAPFRPAMLVRRQVTGDDVWTWVPGRTGWGPDWTEIRAPTEVEGGIDKRPLAKIGGSAGGVIEVGRPPASVPTIAIARSVDYIASQSGERLLSSGQIRRAGPDL